MTGQQDKPNTISDEQWADLKDRAERAETRSMFHPEVVKQRVQSNKQAKLRRWS